MPVGVCSAGEEHTCVLLDDDTIKCVGRNSDGDLGLESDSDTSTYGSAVNVGRDENGDQLVPTQVSTVADQVQCHKHVLDYCICLSAAHLEVLDRDRPMCWTDLCRHQLQLCRL